MTWVQWTLVLVGVGLSAIGGFFLKLGARDIQYGGPIHEIVLQVVLNWRIFVGVMMYFIPVAIWIFLFKKVELSFLQPLFSLVYVITPILAIVFLGETVSVSRWVGILIILAGVIVVART